jgi:hypothetical protein
VESASPGFLSARMMVEARVTVKRVLLRRNPEKNSGYSIG